MKNWEKKFRSYKNFLEKFTKIIKCSALERKGNSLSEDKKIINNLDDLIFLNLKKNNVKHVYVFVQQNKNTINTDNYYLRRK